MNSSCPNQFFCFVTRFYGAGYTGLLNYHSFLPPSLFSKQTKHKLKVDLFSSMHLGFVFFYHCRRSEDFDDSVTARGQTPPRQLDPSPRLENFQPAPQSFRHFKSKN